MRQPILLNISSFTITDDSQLNCVLKILQDKMCTAVENHCPSCCTNHGGVYARPCLVLYQSQPQSFVQIIHSIDEQNPKVALETCHRCKRKNRRHSSVKRKRVNLPLLFIMASEYARCEICQNYQVDEEQLLRIISSI